MAISNHPQQVFEDWGLEFGKLGSGVWELRLLKELFGRALANELGHANIKPHKILRGILDLSIALWASLSKWIESYDSKKTHK